MCYKIYPISGIEINKQYKVLVNKAQDDYVIFLPKHAIQKIIDTDNELQIVMGELVLEHGVGKVEAESLLKEYPQVKTYAVVLEHREPLYDTYYLKAAIAMLYIAKFLSIKNKVTNNEIWELNTPLFYHDNNNKMYMYADVKIGDQEIVSTDFEIHTPCIYSTESTTLGNKRHPIFIEYPFDIVDDITTELAMLEDIIAYHKNKDNILSALGLFYKVLPQTEIENAYLYFSTILEALLTDEKEQDIKKKIAVRAACLVCDGKLNSDITYMANWIKKSYEYRCAYVHNGAVFNLSHDDDVFKQRSLILLRYCIPYLLESFHKQKINSVDDIKKIVKDNVSRWSLNNGFDFITEDKLILYNE